MVALTGKVKKFLFVGFDVETVNDKFYSGGLWWKDEKGNENWFYTTDKRKLIEKVLSRYFCDYKIVATNLGYDFNSLFYDEPEWNKFNAIIMKNSRVMFADWRPESKRKVHDGKNSASHGRVTFYDTLNYAQLSVEKLGEILRVRKMKAPDFLGQREPITYGEDGELKYYQEVINEKIIYYTEAQYLEEYNKRDCMISCLFAEFFQKGLNELGGKMQMTSASSAMDLYRRAYMKEPIIKEKYILKDDSINDFIFSGYYGGRTEAFSRGKIEGVNYYDVNSLYPYVMLNKMPLPQSVKIVKKCSERLIHNFMGVTSCEVIVPKMMYPPLPVRSEKLIFPTGKFKGTWNNNELSYAISQGVKIKKITKQIIYQKSHTPFKEYVTDLYKKRLMYKKENNSFEIVVKLMMNSLYGKFAQKNISEYRVFEWDKLDSKHAKIYYRNDNMGYKIDHLDNKIIFRKDKQCKAVFIFPIYSSYITSYARIHLHKLIIKSNALYVDTDSIITYKEMEVSEGLGGLKCEGSNESAIIVKPKFYTYADDVKIKGLSKTVDGEGKIIKTGKKEFNELIKGGVVNKKRFSGLKESVRRGIAPNTTITTPKTMDVEDNKRVWNSPFSPDEFQTSEALQID